MVAILAALSLLFQVAPDERVRLDFPDEVELKAVVDYVSATLEINVLYDAAQVNKKVSLRVAHPVAKSSLLGLLRTVLRGRGLALVEAEQKGWYNIVPVEQLTIEAGPVTRDLPAGQDGAAEVLTYVLAVRHGDLPRIQMAVAPYLSKPGGTILAIPENRLLVLTDYARNVRRAVEIAALLDVESAGSLVETIPVKHQDAGELAAMVRRLLTERGPLAPPAAGQPALVLQPDTITGGIVALGTADQIARARQLIERFDVPISRRTELYQPKYIAVSRLRTLIEQMIGSTLRQAADSAGNTLAVTARDDEHARIRELLERFDSTGPVSATPLRFYKLFNRRADDVFVTLGALLGGQITQASGEASSEEAPFSPVGPNRPPPGINDSGGAIQIPPRPPAERPRSGAGERSRRTANGEDGAADISGQVTSIRGENFSLSLDEHTNSIIAIAPPELHQQIEQFIRELDKRRPQVLVEVTLISIDVSDSLDLGVELESLDLDPTEAWRYELFTSFGLSSIDPTDGTREMTALPGGSGVLLRPDQVPFIVRALASRGDTRVYSAPRILVDDNASGRIESVSEAPFTSVNASQTVATTSFAGFAKAGTQLEIEPHIAEGDHLEIDYSLTVSAFTGAGSSGAPPPRSSNTISSTIRVPDGNTVIVGGLLTETEAESSSHVPLAGDVPILGWLFGARTHSKSKVRLYAFIRPTILRDERFEDLKYLSTDDLETAGLEDGFPSTRVQYMSVRGPWRPKPDGAGTKRPKIGLTPGDHGDEQER